MYIGEKKGVGDLQFTLCKEIRHVFSKMVPCSQSPFLYDQALSCRTYRIYKRSTAYVNEYACFFYYSYMYTREILQVHIKTLNGLYEAKPLI